nr:retrovirus-related Pol polyprotein from transposon TNT 1-94 [Tanacetum cinerariifolium]
MGSQRSKEDDVLKISTSIFVTNFPDRFGAKDLWITCKPYRHVVDTYIPDRRSKAGKRFGFMLFVKITDVDRLVNNLCTVWVGRLKLYANVARYQRDPKHKQSYKASDHAKYTDKSKSGKNGDGTKEEISLCLLRKVKDFTSLTNLKVVLANEGYTNIELKYMGGFWVMIVFQEDETMNKFRSSFGAVPGWVLDFEEESDEMSYDASNDDDVPGGEVGIRNDLESKGTVEEVPETFFDDVPINQNMNDNSVRQSASHSEDPFGFTPNVEGDVSVVAPDIDVEGNSMSDEHIHSTTVERHDNVRNGVQSDTNEFICLGHFKKSAAPRTGGSILHLIDDLVKKIDLWCNKRCWGNFAFDYAYSEAVGTWVPSGMKMLIVSVYAPQEFKEKKMLWDYLRSVVSNWDGQVVIMGDFNEVCDISERFGSVFNKKGAEVFNNFITNAGLVEFEIDGFDKFVEESWKDAHVNEQNPYSNFMKKLKLLKEKIRMWFSIYKEITKRGKRILKTELEIIDSKIDRGDGYDSDVNRRHDIIRLIQDIEKDCGIDKAPGPNGFTFGFYRRYWSFIENDVVDAIKWFFVNGKIPKGGDLVNEIQSAFVADRQILDGPFILHELVQWNSSFTNYNVGARSILWNQANIDTLTRVLDVFYRALGLQIIISKSKLLRIFVEASKLEHAAAKIRCAVLKTPFIYLGSRVGDHMSRIQSWNEIIEGMVSRLSKWKVKTLLIGGRLTLLKLVLGAIPIYHMSIFKVSMKVLQNMEAIRARFFNGLDINTRKPCWVSWKEVMALKDNEGLGVSSMFAPNRSLLFKWVWRFISQKYTIWARVIKALHGEYGKIGNHDSPTYPSIWLTIIQEVESLKAKGIVLSRFIAPILGEFSVSSVRKYIDDHLLPSSAMKTRWIKEVPIKINVHAWKVKNNGFPSRDTNSYEEWLEWLISIRLPSNLKKVLEATRKPSKEQETTLTTTKNHNSSATSADQTVGKMVGYAFTPTCARRDGGGRMTDTQTPLPATTVVNSTGAPVTNTVANHAERPEKFNGQNFRRWQQKMFFYLTTLGLARFLKETVPQHKRKEMSVEDLVVRLRIEENNRLALKDTCTPDSAKANMIKHVGSSSRSNPKGKGKDKRKNDKKSKGKSEYLAPKAGIMKQKFQGTCYNCDQPGHRAANYKMSKRVNPHQADMVNDDVDMIAMVSDVCAMISESMFHSFRAVDNGQKLYMGNSATADIKGEGDVILKMTSKKELKLTNVLYVQEIRKNLVSGWLLNKGYAMNGMFKLNVMVVKNEINKMNSSTYLIESSNVWHGRLGHVNFNSVCRLIKLNSIPNFYIDSKNKCKTCVEAKLTRTSFKSVKRKTEPLDMVHTDICDLKSLPTKGGNKYFITFIDDCTKYCYVYLLKSKNEAIDKFVLYKTEVENQHGKKIKVVRSDRGGEYVSPFADLCAKHEIRHECTAPYSPQQNGYVEGSHSDGYYLLNKIPRKEKEETPYELWMGRKPSYQYLRVWGCLAKETRSSSRLDDKVVQDKRQRDENDLQDEREDQVEEVIEPRRGKRARTEKLFGPDFVSFMMENKPTSYREAVTSSEGHQWKVAIKSEIDSILQNHTWELVDLPPGCLDYFDTYLPVTRITSIRMILAITALRNLEVHQMDVKTAFLNGDLEEEIYMNQPEGFIAPGQEGKVSRLFKSLYGLKQAHKQWHQKFDHAMLKGGFKINECDKCVYVKDTSNGYVILCLYIDDMLIVGSNDKMIKSTKDMLKLKFDMKDMGLADVILGIKIIRTHNGLVLSQAHYMDKILNTHNAGDSSLARTPIDTSLHLSKNRGVGVAQLKYSRIIDMLMYLMMSTRPDLAYAVSRLRRLHYDRHPAVIKGYSDANWISDIKDSRSTSGYVFTLGGAAISWKSSKQTVIAKSTMESEFIALDKCREEAEWLRQFVENILRLPKPVTAISIHCDSQSTIGRAQSTMYNGKSKHIHRRHNSIRQLRKA